MDQATHIRIVSFLWGIADDVLRDLFKRGKYPDVILPMCVLRRLDAVLEPTKARVLEAKQKLDAAEIKEQDAALRAAADQAFYNVSPFVLRDLTTRGSEQKLRADFEAYLEGFSDNVQDVLENFKFRNHIPTLSRSDSLGTLISKFLDPQIDLSPAALDNHAMGTVFEELVRRFNEDNNEEAGEHWTPRDAVRLMSNLIFQPIANQVKSGSYLLYLNPGDEVLRGTALLSEGAEHTGDMVITVISRTEDSAVEVTYDCVPVLEQGIAQVRFEAAAHGFWSDPLYRWTVNGEPSPVTGDELDWDFSQQGRYRVNLTVIDRIGSVDAALGSWSKDIVVFDELPEVGERGPAGGWIIVDKGEVSEGWRFLEAAPEDLSAYGTWSFAYSSDTGHSAEELANRYSRDGFDDWFLPAAEHLELMHAVLYTQGLEGFAGESLYWSSSQADSPGSAQAYRFTDASVVTAGMYRLSRIRPVRGF